MTKDLSEAATDDFDDAFEDDSPDGFDRGVFMGGRDNSIRRKIEERMELSLIHISEPTRPY